MSSRSAAPKRRAPAPARTRPRTKAGVVAAFRKDQILAAARDRFSRQGVTDTTVDDIARTARVAKGTVYLYYRSKHELLRQLLDADLEELSAATLPVIADAGPLAARLQRYFEISLEFFDRNRDFIEHCQLEMSPDVRKKVKATLSRCYQDQADAWSRSLGGDVARGAVAKEIGADAAWQIVGLARGMALQRLAGWTTEPLADAASRAGLLLLKGLATR